MESDFAEVYRSPRGEVRLWAMAGRSPDGSAHVFHRLVFGEDRTGVVVVARSGEAVLLGESYRAAAASRLWEFPRGLLEPVDLESASAVAAAARRELREETGLEASSATILGAFVVDSAIYPLHVTAVECVVADRRPVGSGDGEIDALAWVDEDELSRRMTIGEVRDGLTLSAIALWRNRRQEPAAGPAGP